MPGAACRGWLSRLGKVSSDKEEFYRLDRLLISVAVEGGNQPGPEQVTPCLITCLCVTVGSLLEPVHALSACLVSGQTASVLCITTTSSSSSTSSSDRSTLHNSGTMRYCCDSRYSGSGNEHGMTHKCMLMMQEYTDDTAELWHQLDALGGMAGLQEPEKQLLALPELEQYVSAVRHACLKLPVTMAVKIMLYNT